MEELLKIDKSNEAHYKVLKLIGGDEVFCKVVQEFADALVVEMPMTIVKHQVVVPPQQQKNERKIVEHTGLDRWMNYTHDETFIIYKERILSFGSLAPEVLVYYKLLSKKAKMEDGQMKDVEESEIMEHIQENLARVAAMMGEDMDEMELEETPSEELIATKRVLH